MALKIAQIKYKYQYSVFRGKYSNIFEYSFVHWCESHDAIERTEKPLKIFLLMSSLRLTYVKRNLMIIMSPIVSQTLHWFKLWVLVKKAWVVQFNFRDKISLFSIFFIRWNFISSMQRNCWLPFILHKIEFHLLPKENYKAQFI